MRWIVLSSILVLVACADNGKDYVASAKCQDLGEKPGTAGYDQCVEEEKMNNAMRRQREEYEQMKQYQQDQKMMHY